MIEEIKKHKPYGATHWKSGKYYIKTINNEWLIYPNSRKTSPFRAGI